VRGATAEGTGSQFRYEYHPDRPPPVVERGRTRPGTGQGTATPEPAARPPERRRGLDLDEPTRETLSGGRQGGLEDVPHDPDELANLPERYGSDRFTPAVSEEDLVLFAQEHFPEYSYTPANRGNEVFRGGQLLPGRARPRGSTVPDLYLRAPRRRPISLDAKNVYVGDRRQWEEAIEKILAQARQRAAALPRGAEQHIVLDLRGQEVTREAAEALRQELADASGRLLRPERIHFFPPELN